MLEAKSLRKAQIPSSLIPNPSPGHLQSTRLALHVDDRQSLCSVYVASGCHVYNIEISTEESIVTKGKECLLIPVQAQVVKSSLVDRCPHRSEIQSVVLGEEDGDSCLIMGTVDSYGHLIVSRVDVSGADFERISYSVPPRHCGPGESSWAGMCFSPTHWSTVAVAHSFGKSIDVYDQDIHLRGLRTLWYPASLSYVRSSLSSDESSTLVVAEGSQLSVWDVRTNSNGGCVQRVCGAIGDIIYAVCSSPSGPIAAGGSDRTVTVYDPRRWSALSRWVHCSKYEITSLSFSSLDSGYIYVQGVDYEISCGQWKESQKRFAFRGDSNWLGFSKCANKDVLSGWCESGSIFVADVVQQESGSIFVADVQQESGSIFVEDVVQQESGSIFVADVQQESGSIFVADVVQQDFLSMLPQSDMMKSQNIMNKSMKNKKTL